MSIFKGKVYSVGDGFCYEGLLKNNGNKYHFVIDCGSMQPHYWCSKKNPKLENKELCNERLVEISKDIVSDEKHINLFILTHLHKDHYNGIEFLFKESIPDTIVMPYLYPEERLCLITEKWVTRQDAEFLAKPYTALLNMAGEKKGEVKLILVRGNSEREGTEEPQREREVIGESRRDIETDEPVIWGDKIEESDAIIKEIENLDTNQVEIVQANSKGIKFNHCMWWFKFFNLEVDENNLEELKEQVKDLTTNRLYEMVTENGGNNLKQIKKQVKDLTADGLYDMVKKNKLKKLRDVYEKLAQPYKSDLNNTSIVIYHSPMKCCGKYGTLITGDINLKENIITNKVLDYFRKETCDMGFFSLPHHGSCYNWNENFIKERHFDNTVCFASTHNYYKNRLNGVMMSDLRCHNITALVVDENRSSEVLQIINTDCEFHQIKEKNKEQVWSITGWCCDEFCGNSFF